MTPELHRPLAIACVGPEGLDVEVEADAAECAALEQRMFLTAVGSLSCRFHLMRKTADILLLHGHLTARVVQTCVLTLEDFPADVEERFTVRCVPEGREGADIDPVAVDEFTYEDRVLDLGEAAAEQLALALDPYPRAPGAAFPDIGARPETGQSAAFAALKCRN